MPNALLSIDIVYIEACFSTVGLWAEYINRPTWSPFSFTVEYYNERGKTSAA